jgi:hypothetical protein
MSGVQRPEWRPGIIRLILVDTPDPAREWRVQVPTTPEGVWWKLICGHARLVRNITAVKPFIQVDAGGEENNVVPFTPIPYWVVGSSSASPAPNVPDVYVFGDIGVTTDAAASYGPGLLHQWPWPKDLLIQPGHFIRSRTVGPMTSDVQWSGVQLLIQEYTYVPPVDVISGEIETAAGKIIAALKEKGGGCPLVATAVGAPTDT